ncbi:hypothetical protein QN386_07155 [Pseudomonas sp. CCI3.2]|uniref:hypothetical protein n=1 Tax=unclassified Pseudomonas TaxID=196821 RepID=UPI002AC957DE|nr:MULTISPECIES: hypothetical protein [unclassified Pseudomonas]MEB0077443.1 hypothetical protein [Pseudomonas sp. MH10out]MEB0101102.1 hypothetical protein [Pseudomonas sp. CCI3.2]MEB0130046.1 hypothetical protein [Pseudomonas sp. CCI2.4]MEB0157202.1 hypothetical protein [Pseudomonas sp. AH2 (2023)]MEB0168468.1 hypothetical protein [Pseudomonas sp. CCC4.4]
MSWCRWALLIVVALLAAYVLRSWYEREIALVIGGTYEEMRQQSSARFTSPYPGGGIWPAVPHSDVQLRFTGPQFGFITPKSAELLVVFKDDIVQSLTIHPHIEPLLLDDALKVVLELQDQWRRGGWIDRNHKKYPPFADTPQWRARLRDANKGGTTYWYAGDKYQATLTVHRFEDRKHPEEERYKITLEVAKPWTPYPLPMTRPHWRYLIDSTEFVTVNWQVSPQLTQSKNKSV